jgi:hypothetical protein
VRDTDFVQTSLDEGYWDPDRDGVRALRDMEAEAGDEEELRDLFALDHEAARAAGALLDDLGEEEPVLD